MISYEKIYHFINKKFPEKDSSFREYRIDSKSFLNYKNFAFRRESLNNQDKSGYRTYLVTYTDGTIEYQIDNSSHYDYYDSPGKKFETSKMGEPAVIRPNGDKLYFVRDDLHRDPQDGPAVENIDGTYKYYFGDDLHNPYGPAVFDGNNKEYWLCGMKFPDLSIIEQLINEDILK